MPISYPINSSAGGGNATQIQGRDITTNSPPDAGVLVWESESNQFRFNNSLIFNVFAGAADCSSTSSTALTRFYPISTLPSPIPNQNAFILVQADIDNGNYTGSVLISASSEAYEIQISSSDFVFFKQIPLSGTEVYSVYASSSDNLSNFFIYNIVASYQKA